MASMAAAAAGPALFLGPHTSTLMSSTLTFDDLNVVDINDIVDDVRVVDINVDDDTDQDPDADDDVEEGDHGEKKATYASLSDAKIDPELEKARDIATMSRRVLKDLVAASTFGDIAAIRKSD